MYNSILRNNRERHIRDLKSELVFDMKLIEENLKWKSDEEHQAQLNKAGAFAISCEWAGSWIGWGGAHTPRYGLRAGR